MDKRILSQLATRHDLERFATKEELDGYKNENLSRLDEVLVILKRLDQERVFTTEWVKRIESEVETHRGEISKIKSSIKLS